ncbi:hypothetical protein [Tropicimonas sp. S265A]|uniref:hypothetical protein n=1 Tax=Tropicimonas sp. S265A TaxID=3415134 RepID=UPI003C7C8CC4
MNRQFILSIAIFGVLGTAVWAQSVSSESIETKAIAAGYQTETAHRRGSARHASFGDALLDIRATAYRGLECVERRHGKCTKLRKITAPEVQ